MLMLVDREEISRGLAESLEYTEIGLWLGRASSVISREVARHGGRDQTRPPQIAHLRDEPLTVPGGNRQIQALGEPRDGSLVVPGGAVLEAGFEPGAEEGSCGRVRPARVHVANGVDTDALASADGGVGERVVHSDNGEAATAVPQRLPATSPLAEVILDKPIWIRTADGNLYPAPMDPSYGLNWGYGGGGPGALALLIHRLLDDVTAQAAEHPGDAPAGLDQLTEHKVTNSVQRARASCWLRRIAVDERGLHLAVREARSSAAARAMLASCSASRLSLRTSTLASCSALGRRHSKLGLRR
jgi:Helix-turn-helix domain